jgi:hypothetical protein
MWPCHYGLRGEAYDARRFLILRNGYEIQSGLSIAEIAPNPHMGRPLKATDVCAPYWVGDDCEALEVDSGI